MPPVASRSELAEQKMKPKINFLLEQTFCSHMFVCTLTLPGLNPDADLSENRTGFGLQNLPIHLILTLMRGFSLNPPPPPSLSLYHSLSLSLSLSLQLDIKLSVPKEPPLVVQLPTRVDIDRSRTTLSKASLLTIKCPTA